jgi:AAA15 family ATPase/GTPase
MIQSISIENFRCFDKTEIKGFQRMNLITGKNNSGKTCLLEALYFILSEDKRGLMSIRGNNIEQTESEFFRAVSFDNQRPFVFKYMKDGIQIKKLIKANDTFFDGETELLNKSLNKKRNYAKLIIDKNIEIPQRANLVRAFDDLQINGLYERVIEAIRIIDNDIEDIRSFASYPTILFLKRKGNKDYQPISFFGDALQKIIRYVSAILSFDNDNRDYFSNYLLIDEIENGIHYTAQKEVWQMLFKLCQHFDIQLFATTHSLEMIKAFEEVCEEVEGEGAYFEMARHAKTNQIIGIKHQIATLEYELETNATIRGE